MSFNSFRVKRLIAPLAMMGLLSLSTRPAMASPESEAKDLFARGREYRANNDCGSAAPIFRKAWTVYPQGLGSLRNLAECEEQLGHFASSRRSWLDLKRALITAPNDPKYDGWDKDSEDAAARLKPKVATFVVDVYVKSPEGEALANDKSGVQIFVNGETVEATLISTPLERDPGTYRIRAQAEDAQPVEQTVALSAGDNPHVTIRITRTPKPVGPHVAVDDGGSSRKTIGYIVGGVGAASLVGSLITFIIRSSDKSKVDNDCPLHVNCSESLRSTVDTGKTMSVVSPVLLAVGIAGVGVGVVIIVTAPSGGAEAASPATGRSPKSKSASVDTLSISAGLGRVDATWRF